MQWKPNTDPATRQQRAELLRNTREFFYQKNVLEVETPALSGAGNTDPFIESIQTDSDHSSRYLHTSPEYPMKRLLAADSGDIYQICKVWRKGEAGRNHNPEFTLLEWYRVGFSYYQLMQEVSDLLHNLLPQLKKDDHFFSYEELFLEKFGINPHIANHDELIRCVTSNISGLSCEGLDQQALLDALLTHCIEPDFSTSHLSFVYDYPVSQSALAQQRKASKIVRNRGGVFKNNAFPVAERFEIYLGQMELGNGYQEEVNYARNQQILSAENKAREQAGLDQVSEDKHFLSAAKSGIPASAGVAIGLDRVLMCLTGLNTIQDVLNFPWNKA